MGMGTAEEAIDAYGETVEDLPPGLRPGSAGALQAKLMAPEVITPDGEVIRPSDAEKLAAEAKADEKAHATK
jgi:hypothetical protein